MYARRVVVTGLGAVSPLGLTFTDTWSALLAGRTATRALTPEDGIPKLSDMPSRVRVSRRCGLKPSQLVALIIGISALSNPGSSGS
jgi:3-oxoacyl-(acyl-carrier-protein) synthase